MKLLLISDTHGHLGHIDAALRDSGGADAVVHAGDFGFYDAESPGRLSQRELWLRVAHSHLPRRLKDEARKLDRAELQALVEAHLPLSELPDYVSGARRFAAPVYAVWGNHEDKAVIEQMRQGQLFVEDLHLLDETRSARVGRFELVGLGGNLLAHPCLFEPGLGGSEGKVWATLEQLGRLLMRVRRAPDDVVRVLVTHVSPGKEPLVVWLAWRLGARLTVSGHMGSPYACVWSAFAIEAAMRMLASVTDARRFHKQPPFYRGCFHINLPDAGEGYAVLSDDDGHIGLRTVSRGFRVPAP